MRVVIKEPQKEPKTCEILDELENFKQIIDCNTIQIVDMAYCPYIAIIMDDEGKLVNKKANFFWYKDIVVGTVIFAGIKDADLIDLTEAQIDFIKAYLQIKVVENYVK